MWCLSARSIPLPPLSHPSSFPSQGSPARQMFLCVTANIERLICHIVVFTAQETKKIKLKMKIQELKKPQQLSAPELVVRR